jgi:4-hydroxy-3-methylbut-2-enyl diphosphate reductase
VYSAYHIVHDERVVRRPPAAGAELAARGSAVIDTVCPSVATVHHELVGRVCAGFDVLYIRQSQCDEAAGAPGIELAHALVEDPDTVTKSSPASGQWPTRRGPHWQSRRDAVVTAARRRFGAARPTRRDDICVATTDRETALRSVAARVEAVIVGSASSSNTSAPEPVAHDAGAEHIERVDGGNGLVGLGRFGTVAATAGASAPVKAAVEVVPPVRPSPLVERARSARVA